MASKKTSRGKTVIDLFIPTRDRLRDRGKKGETYDEIINGLLDKVEA
jgi:hypothetical protein